MSNNDTPKIESWDVSKLIPYENNAKIHTEEQTEKLAKIIKKQGFRVPIRVDENGVIIAGHGRRLAVMKLGYKRVAVIVERGLTEEQKDAARISDNMIGRGGYDEELLANEVMRLSSFEDFDTDMFGMSQEELDNIYKDFSTDSLESLIEQAEAEFEDIGDLTEVDEDAPKVKTKEDGVDYEPSYAIVVECSGEEEQRELYEELKAAGRKCKIQTM